MTDPTIFWQNNQLKRLDFLKQALYNEGARIRKRESLHYWRFDRLGGPVDKLTRYENSLLLRAIKGHEAPTNCESMGGPIGLSLYLWGKGSPTSIAWAWLPVRMYGALICEKILYGGALGKRRFEKDLTPVDVANSIRYYQDTGKFKFPTIGEKK